MSHQMSGVIPPILTLLHKDQTVDAVALQKLVAYMINGGVDGIFAMGTAAEAPMLTHNQRESALSVLAETCHQQNVPLYIGAIESSTARVLELVEQARQYQPAGVVVTAPYYFRYGQKEILRHFEQIREQSDLPMIMYNLPGHIASGNLLQPHTVQEIAGWPNVIGFKDSGGNMFHFQEVLRLTRDVPGFAVLQGVQTLSVASLRMGAHGLVPSQGNFIPERLVRMYHAVLNGEYEIAQRIQETVIQLERSFATEGYSIPVMKAMAALLGCGEGVPHAPLERLTVQGIEKIKKLFVEETIGMGTRK